MSLEDRLLIRKFNRGKAEVLQHIYEKYKDDLMTLAYALLYDKNCAEDVVHDVFIVFIRSCGKLQISENLKGYLSTCVANSARNKNKAKQRHRNTPLEETTPIVSNSSRPDLTVISGEQSQSLASALSKLSYEQREVLLLRLYSSLKFREIARLQNESINTIQGRYRYGLNKLRSLLNSEAEK